MKICSSTCKM